MMRYLHFEYAQVEDAILFARRHQWIPQFRRVRYDLVPGPRRIHELYIWWRGKQHHFKIQWQ